VKLNYGTLAVASFGVLILIAHFWGPPWTVPRIAGVAVVIASFLLLALARVQLGQAFSIQAKATTLVTTGLYSRIRNPIYVFSGLVIAGVILWVNRPWLLLIFAVIIPMQIYRSRKEAKVLEGKFGAAYLEYKRKTWF
jgi:protein-S-isoprenylcysteine O-methyltransferase Ste14